MADLTDYGEAQILEWLMRNNPPTMPASWHVALHTGDPGETGAANEVDGTNWTNYAREAVARSTGGWDAAASEAGGGQRVGNTGEIDFGTPTVSGTQADVTHISVWDDPSAGNCWAKGALGSSKEINDGDPVKILADALGLALR